MKRKRIVSALLAGAALLGLVGCSHVNDGTVIAKEYRPAYVETYPMCMSYAKNGGCTFFMPMTTSYPESWHVELSDASGKHHEWHALSRSAYQEAHVGDHLSITKP